MPVADVYKPGERFGYRYNISERVLEEEGTESAPKESGCQGCSDGSASIFIGPSLFLLVRRRKLNSVHNALNV